MKKQSDKEFSSFLKAYYAISIILCILFICFMLFISQPAHAGELDAWEFNIMGINAKDFQNRNWGNVCIGIVTSYVVHETGHLVTAKFMGCDSYFDFDRVSAMAGSGYEDLSNDQRALYHGGGFLFQTLLGGILTAIPKTRYADFTLGFNSFSSATGLYYGITGGTGASRDEGSDVLNLDRVGYNGTAIAYGSGIVNGVFTVISLDKEK